MKINSLEFNKRIRLLTKSFKDKKNLSQLIIVIIVVLISWSGIKAIYLNASIRNQIVNANQENINQKLTNQDLNYQNSYFSSSEYVRLQARANFGLGDPGEREVIVPLTVANSFIPTAKSTSSTKSLVLPNSNAQNNISSWVNYFINRKPTV